MLNQCGIWAGFWIGHCSPVLKTAVGAQIPNPPALLTSSAPFCSFIHCFLSAAAENIRHFQTKIGSGWNKCISPPFQRRTCPLDRLPLLQISRVSPGMLSPEKICIETTNVIDTCKNIAWKRIFLGYDCFPRVRNFPQKIPCNQYRYSVKYKAYSGRKWAACTAGRKKIFLFLRSFLLPLVWA